MNHVVAVRTVWFGVAGRNSTIEVSVIVRIILRGYVYSYSEPAV